ncbi:MAG: hypothetical protein M3Q33_07945 [Acidobacteriota bacterium]|nr:hypothetical protein [Acidobacteriota bacterium]
MPEKIKEEIEIEENCQIDDKFAWSKDQQEKSYYYDDSHGYKVYNPDEEDDENDED